MYEEPLSWLLSASGAVTVMLGSLLVYLESQVQMRG
jgi:hypothetical protein